MADLSNVDTGCETCGQDSSYILMHASHEVFEPPEFFCELHAVNNKWPEIEVSRMVRDECPLCDERHGVEIGGKTFEPVFPVEEMDKVDDSLYCKEHP
ncbi:hypothetical protein [Vreelandella sp. EE7]